MPDQTESDRLLEWAQNPAAPIVVRLGKNPIADDKLTLTIADLTEATFVGYAPITDPKFGVTTNEDNEFGDVVSEELEFVAGDLIDPEMIYTRYVTRHPAGQPAELLDVNILDEPFLFEEEGQKLTLQVRLNSLQEA